MRVDVARHGGIMGITMRATIDTASLDPSAARAVESAVGELRSADHGDRPGVPDSFQYDLDILDGADRTTLSVPEGDLPDGLRSALEAALRDATPGS